MNPLIEKYWESIPPAWFQVRARVRQTAAEQFNLTVEQFQVLRRIRRGFNRVSTIAEDGRISRPAVSRAVEALVKRGLINKEDATQDRRQTFLSLTAAGQEALTTIYAVTNQWLNDQFSTLTEDEQTAMMKGMEVLFSVFGK